MYRLRKNKLNHLVARGYACSNLFMNKSEREAKYII